MSDRPARDERADAADRFHEALRDVLTDIQSARSVLRERQSPGGSSYPLFPFIGDGLLRQLDAASLSITKARETVAAYAYEEHLAAVPPPPGDVAGAGQR